MPKKKKTTDWVTVGKDMSMEGIQNSILSKLEYSLGKDLDSATLLDLSYALSIAVRDRLIERWIKTQEGYHSNNVKRVYYLSMEFLIGRLLGNHIINLDIWSQAKEALDKLGLNLEDVCEQEVDAGLGNGGLGRLAACFLDSMATLGIAGHGYGIRYEYGIFHQNIENGYQVEYPDEWLSRGNAWEFMRPEYATRIRFYGKVESYQDKNKHTRFNWVDTDDVIAMPYDIAIPGYKTDVVNTLRLWSAKSSEAFNLEYFNNGDYDNAVQDKMSSENISKVLYPKDNITEGRELRMKQEYFFTAASISDIVRRFKKENQDLRVLPDKAVIQLNETHPALAIPELMRILIDEENIDWDDAWDVVTKTFAFTNHTVMPEALESWSVELFGRLLPRHLEIIYEINYRFLQDVEMRFPEDSDRVARMSIIEESTPKRIRMANLCIISSFSVNGVSMLHSRIIKTGLFKDFYDMFPEKFNNKTNGITQRRWLKNSNMPLSHLISRKIGDKWITDLYELKKLRALAKDARFRKEWRNIKLENKKGLADYIGKTMSIKVDPQSLFDVQVKRIHEYKRQLLFCLYIVSEYVKLKRNPNMDIVPRTFIFGGKAAPGYSMAKKIIKFINNVAMVINRDKSLKDKLKVVFIPNYRVSLAEKIIPASELSEQISTAGMEASGTGCMKFMLNGALTIGTLDGANIEIAEETGKENIFMFGHKEEELIELKSGGYHPSHFINNSPMLKEIISLIERNFFSPSEANIFGPILKHITKDDTFFICADFDQYLKAQDKVSKNYRDIEDWTKKSIINVASSGKFSSDRTIIEYADNIWKLPYIKH